MSFLKDLPGWETTLTLLVIAALLGGRRAKY